MIAGSWVFWNREAQRSPWIGLSALVRAFRNVGTLKHVKRSCIGVCVKEVWILGDRKILCFPLRYLVRRLPKCHCWRSSQVAHVSWLLQAGISQIEFRINPKLRDCTSRIHWLICENIHLQFRRLTEKKSLRVNLVPYRAQPFTPPNRRMLSYICILYKMKICGLTHKGLFGPDYVYVYVRTKCTKSYFEHQKKELITVIYIS